VNHTNGGNGDGLDIDRKVVANTAMGAAAGGLGTLAALGSGLLPILGTALLGAAIAYFLTPERRAARKRRDGDDPVRGH
jgi:hypothetical protein